jgi:hypothetical protein
VLKLGTKPDPATEKSGYNKENKTNKKKKKEAEPPTVDLHFPAYHITMSQAYGEIHFFTGGGVIWISGDELTKDLPGVYTALHSPVPVINQAMKAGWRLVSVTSEKATQDRYYNRIYHMVRN